MSAKADTLIALGITAAVLAWYLSAARRAKEAQAAADAAATAGQAAHR